MTTMRICAEDYLDTATRTVSSEDGEFPDSNLYDQSIRGKVWRSAGCFVITSANKGIVFNIGGGDVTANIVEGTYNNITTFLAAVVTALNAAAAATYTVAQDATTKKIVITKSAGTLNLLWTDVGSTAADVLGFDTGADDTGSLTYTADVVRIHTEEWIKWDLGATSNPQVFIGVGKKGQAIKISENATIKLQGNLTDAWTSPAYEQTITYHELAFLDLAETTEDGLHTEGLRYWRLYIIDKANSNGYVELSNVYLGPYYATTTGKVKFGFNWAVSDFSSKSRLQSGAQTAIRRDRTETFSLNWSPLTNTEKEQFDSFNMDLGDSKPFYIVMDPGEVFSSAQEYSTRYVKLSQPMSMSLDAPNMWSSSWSLEEMT
jgi:hypothetical protein